MTELYKSEAFEPLTDTPWNAARVTDGIQAIVEAPSPLSTRRSSGPLASGRAAQVLMDPQ
jgi:hypothetical protein